MPRVNRTPTAVSTADVQFYVRALCHFDSLYPGQTADDWTIVNPTRGVCSAYVVSTTTRVWLLLRGCAQFAEWVYSDPDCPASRLDQYLSLSDWADGEVAFKICEIQDNETETVRSLTWKEAIVANLTELFREEVLVPIGYSPEMTTQHEAVSRSVDRVVGQVVNILGILHPRDALDALGERALQAASESEEAACRRLALTYTYEHFQGWLAPDVTGDFEQLIETMRGLVVSMDEEEFAAMDLHGLDLALDVPDVIWLEIRALFDEEAELRAALTERMVYA